MQVLDDAITDDVFMKWVVEKLAPVLNAYDPSSSEFNETWRNSVLVLDNVNFHHNPRFLALLDSLGVVVIFLAQVRYYMIHCSMAVY